MIKTQDESFSPHAIGTNIRQLRRKAGLTIRELAELVDIRPEPLGNLERGQNAPSARVVAALAQSLKVSIDAIFATTQEEFRQHCEASATQPFPVLPDCRPIPEKALTQAESLCADCLALEDICGAAKNALIPLRIHLDPTEPGMNKLAGDIRKFMNIDSSIAFDYFELFETCGFRVLLFPFADDHDSFSFFDPANENALFFINSEMNGERQLFQLAFELGLIYLRTSQTAAAIDNRKLNKLARKFAAFFLMPKKSVLATINQLGVADNGWSYELLLRIKHRFGVSAETFLYRLCELKRIDDDTYKKLKNRIMEHCQKTNFAEPDSTRRIITPNARLWDLVQVATADNKTPEPKAGQIRKRLEKQKTPFKPIRTNGHVTMQSAGRVGDDFRWDRIG